MTALAVPTTTPTRTIGSMEVGVTLGHMGKAATRTAALETSIAAEAAGYSSLWAADRLLYPLAPRDAYPASADGVMPEEFHEVLDPLATLASVAAVTERIRLATSVLVAPWYPPIMLARTLATIDVLSDGRLTAGLGIGWSSDEYEAVGSPMHGLGDRLDEALDVLAAAWGPDPVAYDGEHVRIAPSTIRPKPVQDGGPPVLLAAYSSAGFDRIARRAAGWTPAGLPVAMVGPLWQQIGDLAEGHGRDRSALRLVVRANIYVTGQALGTDRPAFHGSLDQVADDLAETAASGAHEVILGVLGDLDVDELVRVNDRLASLAAEKAAAGLA